MKLPIQKDLQLLLRALMVRLVMDLQKQHRILSFFLEFLSSKLNVFGYPSLLGYHPSLHLLDARMVSHRMHLAIAGTEEATQDPADDSDDDSRKKSTPESLHMESGNHRRDKKKQECIDHQNEESHGHDDEWKAQKKEYGADQSIDDS